MPGARSSRGQMLGLGILVEGGLGLLAWGLGWLLHQPPLEHCSWSLRDLLTGVAASLPMLLLFLACLRWPYGPLAHLKRFSEEVVRPLFRESSVWELALISLLAGVGEEMLFRGVLQGALGRWLGLWAGFAVASLLFGLLHSITPIYALLAALLGAYLGWLYLATGNLLVPIAAHAFYDGVALVYLARGPSPGPG
ncbi:MAG: CPBP family intramembrane metalloprotease [Planctomycetes bacterium]|nr:CPBP family intramembrane metalloprotease [Planctomycetota bacterium]